jgi:hypothetical protein
MYRRFFREIAAQFRTGDHKLTVILSEAKDLCIPTLI